MSTENNYIPGTCNIGNEQLKKRKRFLAACIVTTVLLITFQLIFHSGKMWRLFMFIPFAITSVAVQQVLYKFCYRFGLTGLYGFGKVGYDTKVEGNHFRELDRKKSKKMIVSSVLIGLILTYVYYSVFQTICIFC